MASKTVLSLTGIDRHYGQGETVLNILKGADFSLRRGETVALVAPSGTGKSTIIEFFWKLFGRSNYEGFDPQKATVAARAQSGAPVIVCRRSSALRPETSPGWTELASASPRNLT